MEKSSGVLMHISSLWGKYSCGNIKSGYKFIDFLCDCGFSYWQMLPMFIPNSMGSPYASCSSFLGNPYFIDIEELYNEGLITKQELDSQIDENPYKVDFEFLGKNRIPLLITAAKRNKNTAPIDEFFGAHEEILKAVRFYTLYLQNGKKDIDLWETEELNEELFNAWKFIEWRFYRDYEKLHDYAKSRGIKIIGDLPFYVSLTSSDVYYNKDEFLLNENYKPKAVAGVPPDYFAKEGQLWGNPLYNFTAMKKNGYRYFKKKFEHLLYMFDGLRLDHFRAFAEFYAIKPETENAKNGKWVKGPGEDITNLLNNTFKGKLFIAEDLGLIDDKVRDLVKKSGFLSTAVFEFGFDGNYGNPHLPHNYTALTAAYTATHDNNTLLGFMWEESEDTKNAVYDYLGIEQNIDIAVNTVIKTMLQSSAKLVIFPIQDLLKYGGDTRMNIPGVAEGNWTFRITEEQLNTINREYLLHLNTIYSRKNSLA